MAVSFHDLEHTGSPLNGGKLADAADIATLLDRLIHRPPFVFELRGDTHFKLTIGIARDRGFAQHSSCDGSPPYLVALATEPAANRDVIEFLTGGTLTPIDRRFILPIATLRTIVESFVADGSASAAVSWAEI